METKKEQFSALLLWLTQEQKELTILEHKIEQCYKDSSLGGVELDSYEFIAMKINLASKETKIAHIKGKLKDLAKKGI